MTLAKPFHLSRPVSLSAKEIGTSAYFEGFTEISSDIVYEVFRTGPGASEVFH